MRRIVRWLIVVVVLLALGAGAWYYFQPRPVEVVVRAVERGRVEASVSNTRAGTVRASKRSKLAPSTGGQVSRLPVREGDRVKAGDVLLELWNEDLRAQLELSQREAVAAQARAEQTCLEAELAMRDAERARKLHSQGNAPYDALDRAETDARARAAACQAAREATRVASAQITVIEAALKKTTLYAPFSGIVARVEAEIGEFVTPSPPGIPTLPAVDLIGDDSLYVRSPIDEVDAARIRPGMPARVTLDAFTGRSFAGKVRRVAPYVDDVEKQARTVDIDVDIVGLPDDIVLLPGYSADVEVILEARDDVLRIPTETILEGEKILVFSIDRLDQRRVERGLSNWQFTEVLGGLAAGELVVLSLDRDGVSAGARARLEGENGPAAAASSAP